MRRSVSKPRKPSKPHDPKVHGRSRITNGRDLLPGTDRRSSWARRFSDLVNSFQSDLGQQQLSEGQKALVRRVSALSVECENLEIKFAKNEGAKPEELDLFQKLTNSMRRTIEVLGVHRGRIARDITPDLQTYLKTRYQQHDLEDAAE